MLAETLASYKSALYRIASFAFSFFSLFPSPPPCMVVFSSLPSRTAVYLTNQKRKSHYKQRRGFHCKMRKWKGKEIQTKRLVTSIPPPRQRNSSISRRLVHIKLIVYLFICLFFPPFIYFTSHLYCTTRLKN